MSWEPFGPWRRGALVALVMLVGEREAQRGIWVSLQDGGGGGSPGAGRLGVSPGVLRATAPAWGTPATDSGERACPESILRGRGPLPDCAGVLQSVFPAGHGLWSSSPEGLGLFPQLKPGD